jgi:hypothetical protein
MTVLHEPKSVRLIESNKRSNVLGLVLSHAVHIDPTNTSTDRRHGEGNIDLQLALAAAADVTFPAADRLVVHPWR